jgi:hypothetical protein
MVHPHQKLNRKVKIDKDYLPAELTLLFGPERVAFVVTKDSPKKLYFSIDDVFGTSGPRDENTEIEQKRKVTVENMPVDQYEIVE